MRQTSNIPYSFLILILFSLFICLAPSFDLLPWAIRFDEKRIVEIGLLLLAATIVILSKTINDTVLHIYTSLPRLSRWALIYIISAGLLSSVRAPAIDYALMEFSLFILLFFWCMFTAAHYQKHGVVLLHILFIGIYTSAFFYEITFFTSYIGIMIQSNPLVLPEPFSGFSNYRFFNQFQIWTIPLLPAALLLYRGTIPPVLRGLAYTIITGWWILLFASESRGAIIAITAAMVITLIYFQKPARPLLKIQVYSALSGLAIYLFLFIYFPDPAQTTELRDMLHTSDRLRLWGAAWEITRNNPLLGAGPMHFAYYPNPDLFAHPHNSILQISSEWGIPTALLVILLAMWGSMAWVKKFNNKSKQTQHTPNLLWIALFNAFMAGEAYSLVSGVIVTPLSQMMLATIVGIMLGAYFHTTNKTEFSIQKRITFNTFAISILLLATIKFAPHIQYRFETEPPYSLSLQPPAVEGPRFWQSGGIPAN